MNLPVIEQSQRPATGAARERTVSAARDVTLQLLNYCRMRNWAGYDPYDALNSKLFNALPFLQFRLPRLVFTQALKRSPIILRPLLLVPRTQNPKGLALFVAALLKLARTGLLSEQKNIAVELADKLLELRSEKMQHACWGYNFPWQTRITLVPRGCPNIICTTFAANALLDLYEQISQPRYLEAACSAAEFILEVLFWRQSDSLGCFSYTPLWRSAVHNANLLGAVLLCRLYSQTGERKFLEPALMAARYSAGKQYPDGAWDYGESDSPSQRWKDNFHTGYNLCALRDIARYAETSEFDRHIDLGFKFYRNHFFAEGGVPKYYHNATFPIDIHSVAQSIITLLQFKDVRPDNVELADSVLNWALSNMWDEERYFYAQKLPYFTTKIPYMRWAQAWMLLALATFLEDAALRSGNR